MSFRFSCRPFLLSSTAAAAQEAPRPDAATVSVDRDIVVAANRAPTDADRVAASVTLLDKAAIDRSQDLSVADLLVRTPGVTVSRNGGYGTATTLRIRGAEGDQTVVVVDGVKLNDPSTPGGGYDFANLLTGDATRIEVLRGPQSILWGSQAIDGNYSWIVSQDRSPGSATFGNWLPRRPRHAANLSASYDVAEHGSVGAAVRWSGSSFDDIANTDRLDAYTLVDLRAEWPLSPAVRLFTRVENLFDERYRTVARYATLGRGLHAGPRGRF